MNPSLNILTILGHTAAGKTKLAAHIAHLLNGEVISADSRQVYQGMDIGTGKDYDDYVVEGKPVGYHLVDIAPAGYEYNVYEFQKDFFHSAVDIQAEGKLPVLCGGTGMYIESVLRGYSMTKVPVNLKLREQLEGKRIEELGQILRSYKQLHNQTDTDTPKRAVRAIEIAEYMSQNRAQETEKPVVHSLTFGVYYSRDTRRRRITDRLKQRLEKEGMIEEAARLVEQGVSYEKLEYYGLEYKFLAQYLSGRINYDEMFTQLNTAIHRFAKRQMTYFRGMERRGLDINWLQGELSLEKKIETIIEAYHRGTE